MLKKQNSKNNNSKIILWKITLHSCKVCFLNISIFYRLFHFFCFLRSPSLKEMKQGLECEQKDVNKNKKHILI